MKIKTILPILALAIALPAEAQTLGKRLGRSFNDQPYEPQVFFFTAANSEGVLQISNVIGSCPNSNATCEIDLDCTAPGNEGCGPDFTCIDPVTHLLGQVSVIQKSRYCEIAACAGVPPAECGAVACPAGQSYCPTEGDCASCPVASALCLCDGGFTCPTTDAALDPSWVAFDDTFADASNPKHWSLLASSITGGAGDSQLRVGLNPTFDPLLVDSVSDAAVRFPLAVGTDYVLILKQGITPFTLSSTCDPYGQLAVFLTSRASTCVVDGDGDGYPAGSDCNDSDGNIHPNATEICNGKDDDCDLAIDEEPPASASCDDANLCTADACVSGACTHLPVSCDDGISCTLDLCDPAVGCRHEPTSDCTKGLGYYRRQCHDPSPPEPLTPVDAACVAQSDTFSWVADVDDVCAVLDVDPRNDKCKQAEGQFLTLLLNRCKSRVFDSERIDSKCGTNTTVGQSVLEADDILSSPSRSKSTCKTAQCESEEINSGDALGVQRLLLEPRPDGGVRVSWTGPPICEARSCVYRTWRRPMGASTFVLLGVGTGTTFDDVTAVPGTSYVYVATFERTW